MTDEELPERQSVTKNFDRLGQTEKAEFYIDRDTQTIYELPRQEWIDKLPSDEDIMVVNEITEHITVQDIRRHFGDRDKPVRGRGKHRGYKDNVEENENGKKVYVPDEDFE